MNDLTKNMTLEQQIGQTLMVGFWGTTASPDVLDLIQHYHIGNIILFSRNIGDAQQVRALTDNLQKAARAAGHVLPLLIATDQENGTVQRLGDAATLFPGNMTQGAINSEEITFDIAQATGRELLALGINMNLAPVVDVNNNAQNSVIGVRACLKHFPGHGDTNVDSHLALPTIPYDLARLETLELIPFRAGIEAGADSVMISHIYFPALDPNTTLPATLSSHVIKSLLREQLAYNGLIISDCLEMRAVSDTFGTPTGSVMALQAGNALALVSHHYDQQIASFKAIQNAVHNNTLSPQTIKQAAQRVIALKQHYLSWDTHTPLVDYQNHLRLQEKAYAQSTTLVHNEDALLPLHLHSEQKIILVSPPRNTMTIVEDRFYSDGLLREIIQPYHTNTILRPIASHDDPHLLLHETDTNDIFIVATVSAHLDEDQANIVRFLISQQKHVINIALRNPYDLQAYPALRTYLATYEYTRPALLAAVRVLFGAQEAHGHLPVTLPEH